MNKNILFNLSSQLYVTLVAILVVPFYLNNMGVEAYGLIAFYSMLQLAMNLLDIGLTPTISREVARFRAGAVSSVSLVHLYRLLIRFFYFFSLTAFLLFSLSSQIIAERWLTYQELTVSKVTESLIIISMCVSLRWISGLYRGILNGFEQFYFLSLFNSIIATIRFVGVFLVMSIFGFSIEIFFFHQLIVAILEFVILRCKSLRSLPKLSGKDKFIPLTLKPLKSVLRFSLTIAFTSSVWVLITQTDKFILSGLLSLTAYSYFSVAVLVASGIMIISGPISNVIMPRMANLYAMGAQSEMMDTYRYATQVVSLLAGSVAITFFYTSDAILYAWTGDRDLVVNSSLVLSLYAAGNGLLVISSFVYYLQYAKGILLYHVVGNVVLLVTLVPSVIYFTNQFGGDGAAWVWFSLNLFFFIFWVAFVHSKLQPKFHLSWICNDVLKIIVPGVIVGYGINLISFETDSRLFSFLYCLLFGIAILFISSLFSSRLRVYSHFCIFLKGK
ncbi:oligosaccharide flippase family protein [Shewanella algae]|uniref:oligosaccharide flippase family protein n=1 Tax=Shewanella algae TaxID=38313 RepID=UPI0027264B33|nr:oligosaccharide flippase family protein [Shewanella algae]MDO8254151.1 oligosaccharide flippase family protein [Shewanella algae]